MHHGISSYKGEISHWIKHAMLTLFTLYIKLVITCFNWDIIFSPCFLLFGDKETYLWSYNYYIINYHCRAVNETGLLLLWIVPWSHGSPELKFLDKTWSPAWRLWFWAWKSWISFWQHWLWWTLASTLGCIKYIWQHSL